jgi:hypothetical protein
MIYVQMTIMRVPIVTIIAMMIVLFLPLSVYRESLNFKYNKLNQNQRDRIKLIDNVLNALNNTKNIPSSVWATRKYRSSPPLWSSCMSSKSFVQDMQPILVSCEYAMQEQFFQHKLLHMSGVTAVPSAKSGTLTIFNFKNPSSFVLVVLLLTLVHCNCKGVLLAHPLVQL